MEEISEYLNNLGLSFLNTLNDLLQQFLALDTMYQIAILVCLLFLCIVIIITIKEIKKVKLCKLVEDGDIKTLVKLCKNTDSGNFIEYAEKLFKLKNDSSFPVSIHKKIDWIMLATTIAKKYTLSHEYGLAEIWYKQAEILGKNEATRDFFIVCLNNIIDELTNENYKLTNENYKLIDDNYSIAEKLLKQIEKYINEFGDDEDIIIEIEKLKMQCEVLIDGTYDDKIKGQLRNIIEVLKKANIQNIKDKI